MRALCLVLSVSAYAAPSADTIQYKRLAEVEVKSVQPIPERLQDVEEVYLYTSKKNEVLRLDNINANLSTNNTRQIFARIPGVTIWEYGGSGIQINVATRGLSPNRSWEFNTRQNGYDISADVFGYPEAYYNPSLESVAKIQVVRGAASLQFGSQFGGLLNYISKRQEGDVPFALESQTTIGSYGLLGNYTAVSGNTKKWNYYVYNHIRKGNGWRNNSQYETRNTQAFVKYSFSDKVSASLEYTNADYIDQQSGGLTDAQFKENAQQSLRARNWFSVPWNLLNLQVNYTPSERLSFNIKLFGLSGERNSVGYLKSANVADTINKSTWAYNARQVDRDEYFNLGSEIRGVWQYDLWKQKHTLSFGTRIYRANTIRRQKGVGTTGTQYDMSVAGNKYPTDYTFETDNVAVFLENSFYIGEHFSVTPGIRYEYMYSTSKGRNTVTNGVDVNVTPNAVTRNIVLSGLGLQYTFNTSNIYANVAQAFRPIMFSNLVPTGTTALEVDPNLKDVSGITSEIGYRGHIRELFNFDVSVFYINYANQIGDIARFVDNDTSKLSYTYRTNIGGATHFGAELYAECDLLGIIARTSKYGSLNLFASLSVINATYDEYKSVTSSGKAPNVIIKEENLKNKRVAYAPEQIHNMGLTYKTTRLSATLQTRITTDVYTDASNTESTVDGSNGKIAGYNVWDFSMEYKPLQAITVKAGVNNIMDERYATRRSTGYPGPGLVVGEGRSFYLSVNLKL